MAKKIRLLIDADTLKVIKSTDKDLEGHFVDKAMINLMYTKRKNGSNNTRNTATSREL